MSSAILLIAHGSRENESNEAFRELVRDFQKKVKGRLVGGAFLELAEPSIPEGIDACVREGVREICVVPLMLFWGRHVKRHIPQWIEEAKRRHPGVRFHYAGPLADGPEFLNFLAEQVDRQRRAVKGKK